MTGAYGAMPSSRSSSWPLAMPRRLWLLPHPHPHLIEQLHRQLPLTHIPGRLGLRHEHDLGCGNGGLPLDGETEGFDVDRFEVEGGSDHSTSGNNGLSPAR